MNLVRGVSHLLAAVFSNRAQFDQAWRSYMAKTGSTPFEGQWQGEWVSAANGHKGNLKCLLTHAGAGAFEANFRATYARFLSVAYQVVLKAEPRGAGLRLKGEADLGTLAGGIYSYEGALSDSRFECTYQCKYDHGAFHLKRLN